MQVGPGDVLYLPACWFHRVSHRCSGHDYVMALNYWWVLCALRECAFLNLRGNKVLVAEGRVCYFPAYSTALCNAHKPAPIMHLPISSLNAFQGFNVYYKFYALVSARATGNASPAET